MKIIVVGAGKTGSSLIKNLSVESHDIVAIDIDSELVQENIEKYDINGIVGNGCLAPILIEAGAEDADLFIAVTDKDEMNILSCVVGKSLGAQHIIAQVRDPQYYENFESMGEKLGINMFVNLEATLADKIATLLKAPAGVNLSAFYSGRRAGGRGGRLEIAECIIDANNRVCGKSLAEIRATHKCDFLIVAIERGEKVIVPNGNTVIEADDIVSVCTKHGELRKVATCFGIGKQKVDSAMILGCEEDAYYLAARLLDEGVEVKLIGKDRDKCEDIKTRLEKLNVICDDYNDKEVLIREGIDETDALVAMTPSDENNIVASLYARTRNEDMKVVTIVNTDLYRDMLEDIDLNLVLSPYELSGAEIAKYTRSINVPKDSQIISMNKIAGGKSEALRFTVGKNELFVGKQIAELSKDMLQGVLVCAIIRGRAFILPHGDTVLEEDDDIIIASLENKITKLEDILK